MKKTKSTLEDNRHSALVIGAQTLANLMTTHTNECQQCTKKFKEMIEHFAVSLKK